MNWFYQIDGKRVGPVDNETMRQLLLNEIIKTDTFVWNENLTKWIPYCQLPEKMRENLPKAVECSSNLAPVDSSSGDNSNTDSSNLQQCSECGNSFPPGYLAKFGDRYICVRCKNIYVQKMREGISESGPFNYAGFWIRLGAYIIDAIILGIANFIFQAVYSLVTDLPDVYNSLANDPQIFREFIFSFMILFLIQFAVAVGYPTFFVGNYGATPGKMVCGLKVIRPDGSRVSYLRALARYFAQILSGMILCIGFLMIAFDDECRALHDRICDTRVIRTGGFGSST
jgi:uncharacterized RDD family membrane protein YckC